VPELLARTKSILRRVDPDAVAEVLSASDLTLDRKMRRVTRGGRDIDLSPTEFRLLEHLLQSPGRVYSRAQLLDAVWGRDIYVDERTVDVHVGRLRKAITRGRESDPIRTVRGLGYSFDERFSAPGPYLGERCRGAAKHASERGGSLTGLPLPGSNPNAGTAVGGNCCLSDILAKRPAARRGRHSSRQPELIFFNDGDIGGIGRRDLRMRPIGAGGEQRQGKSGYGERFRHFCPAHPVNPGVAGPCLTLA